MSLSEQVLQCINRIAEELNQEECKRLSYLCGELHTERLPTSIREMLQSCLVQLHTDQDVLMELMLRIRRYDLLSKVLGINKTDAEELLKNGHALSDYRVLMAELSEDFGADDLKSLVFLLRGVVPKEKVEKFESFLDVVVELEKMNQISSTRMDVMEKYLRAIHRVDLVKRLHQYQSRVNTVVPQRVPFSIPCEQWQENEYRMQRNPRGVCVIIDCVGTEGAQLEQLFLNLHFRVSLHMLLSFQEILSCLKQVSRQTEHFHMDAFVCCIISRSRSFQLLGTDSYGLGLDLDTIRQYFTSNSCPGLTGKPKLFFIQGYEISEPSNFDYEEGELETDSPAHQYCRMKDLPGDADVFWSHCWTNEKQLEDSNHHSVYIQSLKQALVNAQIRRTNLVDLHMTVNRAVFDHNHNHPGSAYHINLRHTLRKNVYLL